MNVRTIRWKRSLSGREVEVICNGKPLEALPQGGPFTEPPLVSQWSYEKGQIVRVETLDGSDCRDYVFHDVTNERVITGVPGDAFEFIDSDSPPPTTEQLCT